MLKCKPRVSLVVEWLRFWAPNAGDLSLIPGQGTRSHMPQLRVHILQGKILCATTKTQHSQINKLKNNKYFFFKKRVLLFLIQERATPFKNSTHLWSQKACCVNCDSPSLIKIFKIQCNFKGYIPFTIVTHFWLFSPCCTISPWACLISSSSYLSHLHPFLPITPSPLVATSFFSPLCASFSMHSLVCCIL